MAELTDEERKAIERLEWRMKAPALFTIQMGRAKLFDDLNLLIAACRRLGSPS